jgi:acyl-coenzyme A synthetase/AMP-(fatty) acid ligase
MYGMEFSVMLPMLGGMAVHSGRPLLPADIALALAEIPAPRVLVTTPMHLRVLMESGIELPPLAGVISATAPFDQALALKVEQQFATILFEMFGSTETCIFATRRTAYEKAWRPYPNVEIVPRPDGVQVSSPWFAESVMLQDIVEMLPDGGFTVCGRNSDFIDVAGKRASLAELTRRLQAVQGVWDAVVFPPEQSSPGQVRRVAALAVAPGLTERTVIERLSASVDPAFLPRPLVLVDQLPRNETGKLPREQLLACLKQAMKP